MKGIVALLVFATWLFFIAFLMIKFSPWFILLLLIPIKINEF